MKILLVNKFYYRRGGDCVYMLSLEEILKAHGHEVAVFAMDYPENQPSEWEKYFPSEVNFRLGKGMIESFLRPLGYSREVRKKFKALLDAFQPDVVHLNIIHSHLSPVIAEIAHNRGIKVVWTMHEYKLLCPRYDCLRNGSVVCEECFRYKSRVLAYKCMKNSMLASVLAYGEAVKWNRRCLDKYTDVFICPSQFIAEKMLQGGFSQKKLVPLCNFIDVEKCKRNDGYTKKDYYCFIGRLSHEKGVKTLIEASNRLPDYRLIIIGGGPIEKELKAIAGDHVEFVGFKQWNEIKVLVGGARFCVIPSEWYENNPLSIIEAKCLGTPVLGARIGGIPELIDENSGFLFESRNVDDLTKKIQLMFSKKFDYESMAKVSLKQYSAEEYYKSILKVYASGLNFESDKTI